MKPARRKTLLIVIPVIGVVVAYVAVGAYLIANDEKIRRTDGTDWSHPEPWWPRTDTDVIRKGPDRHVPLEGVQPCKFRKAGSFGPDADIVYGTAQCLHRNAAGRYMGEEWTAFCFSLDDGQAVAIEPLTHLKHHILWHDAKNGVLLTQRDRPTGLPRTQPLYLSRWRLNAATDVELVREFALPGTWIRIYQYDGNTGELLAQVGALEPNPWGDGSRLVHARDDGTILADVRLNDVASLHDSRYVAQGRRYVLYGSDCPVWRPALDSAEVFRGPAQIRLVLSRMPGPPRALWVPGDPPHTFTEMGGFDYDLIQGFSLGPGGTWALLIEQNGAADRRRLIQIALTGDPPPTPVTVPWVTAVAWLSESTGRLLGWRPDEGGKTGQYLAAIWDAGLPESERVTPWTPVPVPADRWLPQWPQHVTTAGNIIAVDWDPSWDVVGGYRLDLRGGAPDVQRFALQLCSQSIHQDRGNTEFSLAPSDTRMMGNFARSMTSGLGLEQLLRYEALPDPDTN